MRLGHEDRQNVRRMQAEYRSRPQSDVPPTKAPDFERPDAATIGMALLAEELHTHEVVMTVEELDATRAERFGHAQEIAQERFHGIELEAVCESCGYAIEQDPETGFYRHARVNPECAIATLSFRESRL